MLANCGFTVSRPLRGECDAMFWIGRKAVRNRAMSHSVTYARYFGFVGHLDPELAKFLLPDRDAIAAAGRTLLQDLH